VTDESTMRYPFDLVLAAALLVVTLGCMIELALV
jgi:hypothetical protein